MNATQATELDLVTGGCGYFGSILARRLRAEGRRVRVFDRSPAADSSPGIEHVRGDIRDRDAVARACDGVTTVYHNVAEVLVANEPRTFWEVNFGGTRNLLEAAAAAGARKVVHTSSSAVLGAPERNPVDESAEARPHEDYGRSKLAAEELCADHVRRGLDVTVVRPTTIVGPGRLGIMQIVFEWVRLGRNVPVLGAGDSVWQFVHGDDLADACVRAALLPGADVFNIGAERYGTLRATLQALALHAGTGSRVVSLPAMPAVALMRLAASLRLSPLGPYHALMYGRSFYYDVSRAKAKLGWSARFGNDEMFCAAYDWYLAHRDEILVRKTGSHHTLPAPQGVLRVASWLLG
jgi:nucleoside-diphosphate-sugar epimerase